jgi:TrmH family RNA methyltransferase
LLAAGYAPDSSASYHRARRRGKGKEAKGVGAITGCLLRDIAQPTAAVYATTGVCYACGMAERETTGEQGRSSGEGAKRPLDPSSSRKRDIHTDVITSRDNQWLKKFRAALRGTGPEQDEPIGVEGPKLIEDAVRSGLVTEALLVSDTGQGHLEQILRAATQTESGIPRSRVLRVTDKLFRSVAGTETPQGVAALFRQPVWGFEDALRGPGQMREAATLVVVMVGVQDPGNVGTIVRSAEAFDATGVVAARGTADPWSPKALRASAGSAVRLPVLRGIAVPVLLAQLKMARVRIFAAGASSYDRVSDSKEWSADLREPAAIFIGSEGAGLPPEVAHAADASISIPMSGGVESLNAGVAASVVLFEAARQRKAM